MLGGVAVSLIIASGQAELVQAQPTGVSVNPRVIEPFERDWVLMDWALRFHDPDKDARLSIEEAVKAAEAFKRIADGDGDGRVSTYEYDRAREFLLARY